MIRGLGLVMALATANLLLSCNSLNKPVNESAVSDKLASPEAIHLLSKITANAQKGVMIGHQDALAYGMGWKGDTYRTDINDACGDFPAVYGWDLGHIADSVNIDSVPFSKMKTWAIEVYKRGGINTYSWHARHIVTGGSSWDITPGIDQLLPNGAYHEAFKKQLDLLSNFFSSLKTPDGILIPVVFRPFHEMNGGWFWWGSKSCTPEQYQALFQFTVNYLRNQKQLHNILYTYSPNSFQTREEYLTYYPGDEFIDILGVDDYQGLENKANLMQATQRLTIVAQLALEKGKQYIIAETGLERLTDAKWFTENLLHVIDASKAPNGPAWVLLWRNGRPDHFYAPYPGHSSVADFMVFKNNPKTLFLSDIK
ncbi:MAG: glycosyl hydrolase [Salinivirgaceae bacterium]